MPWFPFVGMLCLAALRHVEIGANEYALALEIEVGESDEFHW